MLGREHTLELMGCFTASWPPLRGRRARAAAGRRVPGLLCAAPVLGLHEWRVVHGDRWVQQRAEACPAQRGPSALAM